ncbi:EamA/RhaT family transporter, partial [Burkholderia multivorans]
MQILASVTFVLIWSTGFIVAPAIGDAPQTFLFCRFL